MLDDFKSWLQGQLTASKAKEQSWVDLAGAIAESIHNHVDVYLDRLKSRNSLYDMEKQDLLLDSVELRKVFPIEDVTDEDLPHVLMQRRDEIHFKKTVYPLVATLAREFEFQGMKVTWQPLYAPKDQDAYPYGTLFATEQEIHEFAALSPDDFFLTSRGTIRVPINEIEGGYAGVDEAALQDFERKVRRVIYPLLPLKIVCDGQVYYINLALSEFVDFIGSYKDEVTDQLASTVDASSDINRVQDLADTTMSTDDLTKVTSIYGTPRADALPVDAIGVDRVYY